MYQHQGTVQLSLAQVITLAADAAAALAFLHERGIAHRDVAGTFTHTHTQIHRPRGLPVIEHNTLAPYSAQCTDLSKQTRAAVRLWSLAFALPFDRWRHSEPWQLSGANTLRRLLEALRI